MRTENLEYDGKRVGSIINGCLYVSHRKSSKHLFRGGAKTMRAALSKGSAAWGIDHELLLHIKALGIKVVCVHDQESGVSWWAGTDRWLETAKYLNLGHGTQRFLNLNDMRKEDDMAALVAAVSSVLARG